MKRILFTGFLLLLFFTAKSNNLILVGRVVDMDTEEAIAFATVYYANTSIGTTTDIDGHFLLKTKQQGVFDLVISHVSYETHKESISLHSDTTVVLVKLKIRAYPINPVEKVGNDPNRSAYLRSFKLGVIGNTETASECEILNPNVLHFKYNSDNKDSNEWVLTAKSDSILKIQNPRLGYIIHYNLEYFQTQRRGESMERGFYGYPFFEDIIYSSNHPKRILANRKMCFKGSRLHFFRSLYAGNLKEEGFEVYKLTENKIRKANKQDFGLLGDSTFIGKANAVLVQTEIPLDLYQFIKCDSVAGSKILTIHESFEIRYTKKSEERKYYQLGYFSTGLKARFRWQASIVNFKNGSVCFYADGNYLDPENIVTIGYWSYKKLGDTLPFNYNFKK